MVTAISRKTANKIINKIIDFDFFCDYSWGDPHCLEILCTMIWADHRLPKLGYGFDSIIEAHFFIEDEHILVWKREMPCVEIKTTEEYESYLRNKKI